MLNNKDIKLIRALQQKKYRQKYNYFVVEGEKMSSEVIKFAPQRVVALFCLNDFYAKYKDFIENAGIRVEIIDRRQLGKLSALKTPNGAIVIVRMPEKKSVSGIKPSKNKAVLFLDRIQDPGNMGTILRTCVWFGIKDVILSPGCVDVYNPKVVQASMGAILRISIYENDFDSVFTTLKDTFSFYATLLEGESVFEEKFVFPLVLVAGNESSGISGEIIEKVDRHITIPGQNNGMDSLNVAVATGITVACMRKGRE